MTLEIVPEHKCVYAQYNNLKAEDECIICGKVE